MHLVFGSILGGLLTLIGTPPNIIIAAYRTELTGVPFGLFDYSPVAGLNQGTHTILKGVTEVGLISEIGILAGGPSRPEDRSITCDR